MGSCTRRLALGRIGYETAPVPGKFLEYFARGDATEIEVKTDLRAKGWEIGNEQDEVTLDITDEIKVVGHIDGTCIDWVLHEGKPFERLLEVKRMAQAYWQVVKDGGWYVDGLMEKYRWQISCYMLATGLEVVLVCRNGDTGEDHFLYAEEPFYTLNDIKARVLVVEGRARSFGTLDDLQGCDSADYPCPFYYTHPTDREELDGDEAEEVEGLGIAYQAARERERESKAAAEVLRDELRDLLGDRGKVVAGRVRVTKYDSSRTRLDKDAAKRDGIDLSKYESRSPSSTTVRVTVREEQDGSVDE